MSIVPLLLGKGSPCYFCTAVLLCFSPRFPPQEEVCLFLRRALSGDLGMFGTVLILSRFPLQEKGQF